MLEIEHNSLIFVEDLVLTADQCLAMITRFEADTRKVPSVVGYPPRIDPTIRDTSELPISKLEEWQDFDTLISEKVTEAVARLAGEFPGLRYDTIHDTGYRILRYLPGAGYTYHHDFNKTQNRQLAFIFYLNTVTEGGETHFSRSGLKVAAVQGRLAVFPPFWTHRHAGLPPIDQNKYVIVAWACF